MNKTAPAGTTTAPCVHCKFWLIVTGAGEREFLPKMFRSLMERAGCSFHVLTKIGQRLPLGDAKRQKMVGRGQVLPTSDEDLISIPARIKLRDKPCHFVILVDDVEHDRRDRLDQIFDRYRTALHTLLTPIERSRAAVHFFANMLEAYFFADGDALNEALGKPVVTADSPVDVETIRHPKNDLKSLAKNLSLAFDERGHGDLIISKLRMDHILSNPETCAFLRSLFAWCVRQISVNCPVFDDELTSRYQIPTGIQAEMTKGQ
jgi:hypothetical protein